jgi:hypothetical protein
MKQIGCTQAINLDGGDSSQIMAAQPDGGLIHLNQAKEPQRPITSSLALIKLEASQAGAPFPAA